MRAENAPEQVLTDIVVEGTRVELCAGVTHLCGTHLDTRMSHPRDVLAFSLGWGCSSWSGPATEMILHLARIPGGLKV